MVVAEPDPIEVGAGLAGEQMEYIMEKDSLEEPLHGWVTEQEGRREGSSVRGTPS
jgi:hypothetical protein